MIIHQMELIFWELILQSAVLATVAAPTTPLIAKKLEDEPCTHQHQHLLKPVTQNTQYFFCTQYLLQWVPNYILGKPF